MLNLLLSKRWIIIIQESVWGAIIYTNFIALTKPYFTSIVNKSDWVTIANNNHPLCRKLELSSWFTSLHRCIWSCCVAFCTISLYWAFWWLFWRRWSSRQHHIFITTSWKRGWSCSTRFVFETTMVCFTWRGSLCYAVA